MSSAIRYFIAAGLIVAGSASSALAQSVAGGCFAPPAKMTDAAINAFLANPNGLLSEFPTAGLPMMSRVRSLTGSSVSTLDPIVALLPTASSAQKSAIGAGLARAAKACAASTPDYAQMIQEKIASANDSELTASFLQATSEVQTAALGGAGGAGGGGAGAAGIAGGGTVGGSTGSTGGDSSVATDTPTYSVGSGGSFVQRSVSRTQ